MTKPIDTDKMRSRMDNDGWEAMHPVDIIHLCNEIDRLRGEKQTSPQGKTVPVRVAVLVDSEGDWSASGWTDANDKLSIEDASKYFEGDESHKATYFLTANLLVPQDVEVMAGVEEVAE